MNKKKSSLWLKVGLILGLCSLMDVAIASENSKQTLPSTHTPVPTNPVNELRCLYCPSPEPTMSEGVVSVGMRILPDGSVTVQLLRSSGDPEMDYRTVNTLSQWRYDPSTVPAGGVRQKGEVIYEEQGSDAQQQAIQRRLEQQQQWQLLLEELKLK